MGDGELVGEAVFDRVVLFDQDHADVVDVLGQVVQPVCNSLSLLVTEGIERDLKSCPWATRPSVSTTIVEAEGTGGAEKLAAELVATEADLLVLSTVESEFERHAEIIESFRGQTLLVMHNVNFWLSMGRRLGFWKRPRAEYHRQMLRLLGGVDGIVVLAEGPAKYLESLPHFGLPVIEFTFGISQGETEPRRPGSRIRLAIPGAVESKRRDYDIVFDVLETLEPSSFELSIAGVAAGDYGRRVMTRLADLARKGFVCQSWDGYVPRPEFDRVMKGCDVILAPIVNETSCWGVPETYGVTKATGSIGDMIRYGKPGILPEHLPVPARLASSVLAYSDREDLRRHISSLLERRFLEDIQSRAATNADHWSIDEVRRRFVRDVMASRGVVA